jgi:Ca2+-binding RTX toxin-like protein
MAVINGTNNGETLDTTDGVTNGDDFIYGYGGNDTILAMDGADYIVGGAGADYIDGGSGGDRATYSDSDAGVTVSLLNGTGLGGHAHGDTLVNIENLTGSQFDDYLIGDYGRNHLYGHDGHDLINGGRGDDSLLGGDGNDVLKGGGGADFLDGGAGIDTANYSDSEYGMVVSLLAGTATAIPNTTYFARRGWNENDTLNSIENVTGSEHEDSLYGDNARNVLRGLGDDDSLKGFGGNDTLEGGVGNDNLDGGEGADGMVGGSGNDTYAVDNWFDTVTESGGYGMDVVRTSVSYHLTAGSDIEVLEAASPGATTALALTGNASGNVITANAGDNVINGGDGDDELTGLGGQDAFLFNTALNEDYNVDVITDFNVADDTIRLDDAIFSANLGLGNISSGELVIGPAALDANDRIIYDSNTGALYYDSDGVGGTAAIQFAELSPGLALTYLDFYVV